METAFAGEVRSYGGDTVYLSVVDRDHNMVSLIQSNYMNFGSGYDETEQGSSCKTGQICSVLIPSTLMWPTAASGPAYHFPAFLEMDGRRVAFGIQGGWNQPLAHAQFVSNLVDHGMNLQAAIEAPRFTKLTFDGRDAKIESRIDQLTQASLQQRGHLLEVEGAFSEAMEVAKAVMHDQSTGVHHGASDPRKDGAAIPEPLLR